MPVSRCLLAWCVAAAFACLHATVVAEVAIEGLPAGVQAEPLAARLGLQKGAAYDKAKEPADRAELAAQLQDLGYLDADVKSSNNHLPAGIRLTYAVKVRNVYAIEAVKVPALPKEAVQALLDEQKIGKDAPCTRETCDQLAQAIAVKLGINYLFLNLERKLNPDKKGVTLVFTR
jgi:outer membrane protein assembly factor BamA